MAAPRMASVEGNTVVHRKARAARVQYQARAMSPAKALRLALAQASNSLFNLSLVVATVEQVELSHTALASKVSGGGLLVLLDGPEGARGAVCIDDALLTALIEVQTTGRVSGRGATGRAVTRTDAAIAAPLIDSALSGAETRLAAEASAENTPMHWAAGYRFGVMLEDAHAMMLALHGSSFHVFRLMVEVSDNACPGVITFIFPVPEPAPEPMTDASGSGAQRTLEQSAMEAPVSLTAVLGRLTLSLEQLCQLQPGDRLAVMTEPPMQIRLEASQKHVVTLAQLGQMNGARAVRLMSPKGQEALRVETMDKAVSQDAAADEPALDRSFVSNASDAALPQALPAEG